MKTINWQTKEDLEKEIANLFKVDTNIDKLIKLMNNCKEYGYKNFVIYCDELDHTFEATLYK